jgi:Na+/melibiose symporter-like transporter
MTKSQEKQAPSDHENDESRSTLSVFAKVGYGLGHVFNDLCATVWFSYTLLFLKDVLNMPTEAGSYMMLGQISDAIFSAIVGYMTDRYGTKRNWHITGTMLVLVAFPAMFLMQRDVLPYWGNLFYLCTFVTIFQCGWALVQISHLSILPELSTTQKDRSNLNSMRYCLSIFANITVFGLAWPILQIHGGNSNGIGVDDFDKFRVSSLRLPMNFNVTFVSSESRNTADGRWNRDHDSVSNVTVIKQVQ